MIDQVRLATGGWGVGLAAALALSGASVRADTAKPTPQKAPITRKSVTQTHRGSAPTALVPGLGPVNPAELLLTQPRKPAFAKNLDIPGGLPPVSLGAQTEVDQFAQISPGIRVVLFLGRDNRGGSAAIAVVTPPDGATPYVCARAAPVGADPSCVMPTTVAGVYTFHIKNVGTVAGRFKLSFSLSMEAPEPVAKTPAPRAPPLPTITPKTTARKAGG